MAKKYKQKDLGYNRTPTEALMCCRFSNGDVFEVPLQRIADDRDENYKDEREDTVGFVRKGYLASFVFSDWSSNNMNWSDVCEFAVKLEFPPEPFDYEEDFPNCLKAVQGKV